MPGPVKGCCQPAVGQKHGDGGRCPPPLQVCIHPPRGQDGHPSLLKSKRGDSLDTGEGRVAEANPLESLLPSLGTLSRAITGALVELMHKFCQGWM